MCANCRCSNNHGRRAGHPCGVQILGEVYYHFETTRVHYLECGKWYSRNEITENWPRALSRLEKYLRLIECFKILPLPIREELCRYFATSGDPPSTAYPRHAAVGLCLSEVDQGDCLKIKNYGSAVISWSKNLAGFLRRYVDPCSECGEAILADLVY